MAEVQKCWVSCTFLVECKHHGAVISHALPDETAKARPNSFKQEDTSYTILQVLQHLIYMFSEGIFDLQLEVTKLPEQELGCPLDVLLEFLLFLSFQLGCQQLDVLLNVCNKLLLIERRLLL